MAIARSIGVKRTAVAMFVMAAVAMRKRDKDGFCCCRVCKDVFDSYAEFLGHLSIDDYCRGAPDRVVREIVWIILNSR